MKTLKIVGVVIAVVFLAWFAMGGFGQIWDWIAGGMHEVFARK